MDNSRNDFAAAPSKRALEPTPPPTGKTVTAAVGMNAGSEDLAVRLKQGMHCHQSGSLDEAAAIYRKILDEHPDHADALHLAGLIAQEAGDTGSAIDMISRAIAQAPTIPFFHNNLGNILSVSGDLVHAADYYRSALALKDDYAPFHHNLGNCLRALQQPTEAEACYRQALRLQPDLPGVASGLGYALLAQQKTSDAVNWFQQALAQDPQNQEARLGLADATRADPPQSSKRSYVQGAYAQRPNNLPSPKSAAPSENFGALTPAALQRVIAERLLQQEDPQALIASLRAQGIDGARAQHEVNAAASHPYLQAGKMLATRLKKRDWVLDTWRTLEASSARAGQVERRYRLSREEFLREYYSTNRPVIIRGMMDNWSALDKWTPAYLREHYGHLPVEIQANRNADRNYETNMQLLKKEVQFSDYIDMVTGAETNDFYMTANNASRNRETLKGLWQDIDMLPEYLDPASAEKGFFWFGPADTITPLHHDLTNNLMAQVRGRKHIKLIAAANLPYVYNHLHCYSQVDMTNIDYQRFPLMRHAQIMDVVLEPGEILFLPVGCWHYVKGLDISITMTFTHFRFNNDFHSFYQTYNEI